MSIVDKLLKLDAGKLEEKPEKAIEIPRLSELIGEPFMVRCTAITGDRYSELTSVAVSKSGKFEYEKAYKANVLVALESIVEPDLKNEELQKHFNCRTPKELLEKLLNGGEISKIADISTELSGFGNDTDEEIKN